MNNHVPLMIIKGLSLQQATEVSYQLMTKGATFETSEATPEQRDHRREEGDDWVVELTGGY